MWKASSGSVRTRPAATRSAAIPLRAVGRAGHRGGPGVLTSVRNATALHPWFLRATRPFANSPGLIPRLTRAPKLVDDRGRGASAWPVAHDHPGRAVAAKGLVPGATLSYPV